MDQYGFDDSELLTQFKFADFMRDDEYDEYGELVAEAEVVYEACESKEKLTKICERKLEEHNRNNPDNQINFGLTYVMIKHLLRLSRVINL